MTVDGLDGVYCFDWVPELSPTMAVDVECLAGPRFVYRTSAGAYPLLTRVPPYGIGVTVDDGSSRTILGGGWSHGSATTRFLVMCDGLLRPLRSMTSSQGQRVSH